MCWNGILGLGVVGNACYHERGLWIPGVWRELTEKYMSGAYGSIGGVVVEEAALRQLVRDTRVGLALTCAVMAERMGISRPFYTQLEGGKRRMSMYYFLAACRALGMTAEEMFEGCDW